ncbi:transcriptional activator RinB [Escherichia coli]|uniref:transcriptional activator RinB n=1 Tax=Escherichia coli TaxID=562 RepID=UPI003F48F7E8
MIKRILKNLFIIAMYELGKYLMNELIVYLQSEDDIDMPKDFNQLDHIHLNAEVSD